MSGFAGHMLAFVFGAFFMAAATIVVMGLIIRWHREGEHVIGVIDIRRAHRVMWGILIIGGTVIVVILAVIGIPILIQVVTLQFAILDR